MKRAATLSGTPGLIHHIRLIRLVCLVCLTGLCGALSPLAATAAELRQELLHPSLASLKVQVEGAPYAPPVILPGTDDRITISWDDLSDSQRYMRYELIHCNADWTPSRLLPAEYIDGFNEARVPEGTPSRLAEHLYTHYTITLPDADMAPTRSGNYVVRVFDEDNPDGTLLRARFSVSEQKVLFHGVCTSVTDVDYNDAHQQLTLRASYLPIRDEVTDPFSEFITIVKVNGREDNAVTLTAPQRVDGTEAVYEHHPKLIFPGGNEYRRFETVTRRYPGIGVETITREDPYYHFTLATDEPRATRRYEYYETQQGRFTIRSTDFDATDSDVEADYVMVHFTLDMPRLLDADIYIEGDLTGRAFTPENLMHFNTETNRYEGALRLKQGSYDYQYLAVPKGSSQGSTSRIEGDKCQTRNSYLIMMYLRRPGSRADRLVGIYAL